MRTTKTVLIFVCVLLLTAPAVQAQTFAKNEDASENGNHLTEVNDPTNSSSVMDKFGEGYNLTSSTLESESFLFSWDQDLTFTFSFKAYPTTELNDIVSQVDSLGTGWKIQQNGDELFIRSFDEGIIQIDACFSNPVLESSEEYSVSIRHNDRDVLTDETFMKVWDSDGNVVDETNCSSNFDEGDGDTFIIGQDSDLEIYELRVWFDLINENTADQVADPSDSSFTLSPEGTEEALWFFQPVTLADDPGQLNHVHIWTVQQDEETNVYAETMNDLLNPVAPEEHLNLSVTRVEGNITQFYEKTNDVWTTQRDQIKMNPITDTLFNVTLPNELSAESSIQLIVVANIQSPAESPSDLAFGTFDVHHPGLFGIDSGQVDEDKFQVQHHFDISGLDHNHLIELGIWGGLLILALFQGWYMTGFFSMIGVLRVAWQAQTGTFPLDFVAVLFFVIMFLWLEIMLPSWHERLRGWFTNS